jgi:uncharacterized protein (DUF2062 family)
MARIPFLWDTIPHHHVALKWWEPVIQSHSITSQMNGILSYTKVKISKLTQLMVLSEKKKKKKKRERERERSLHNQIG